jgi:hypothetical protein
MSPGTGLDFLRWDKSLARFTIRTADHPAHSVVTVLTILLWLAMFKDNIKKKL